ncbi:MAG: hypothetical protein COV60_03310 [Candidatus Magasanikbacteria bacterium CG11_big_fil_rev_8_21_14_0_20_43_7]|uniref:Glycosyltransferase 2-like domain-containing protein n=1 Tax=Candidatus Magasanikbacteria bacterium CG11_big_fil_rev_8_21_14_0_20_43_7 TaxID=1974654 RepID=A0A2H0N1X8_9BACT|nr:MAG: hypothetical protein COV60_03310 [Candidatus Magasanikbacteria bacterium CG11_big_fil_rev_8_21_14_0_20_43_7]
MQRQKNADISVVIPVRNEEAYLPACFDALSQQTTEKTIEIIVVDNGSSDASQDIARQHATRIVEEPIAGVGRARRSGSAIAQGTYILHIDADTRLPPAYIEQALDRFARQPNLVCLGGQMYWYDASTKLNMLRGILYRMLTPLVWLISRGALGPMGNNMMFPRALYEQCEGFDANLRFGEDADLTRQLHTYGKVVLDLSLVCHTSSRRFGLNRDLFVYCVNVFRICFGMKPLQNDLQSLTNAPIDK